MVAETREKMTEMFETVSDGFRAAMDAGRRSQESMFKAVGDMCKAPGEFDGFVVRAERITREWMPTMGKNIQAMTECCDTGFRAGVEVFKTACDLSLRTEDADVYRKSRQFFDAAFNAARTNFDAIGKAGSRTMENWAEFCRSAGSESGSGRAASGSSGKPSTK